MLTVSIANLEINSLHTRSFLQYLRLATDTASGGIFRSCENYGLKPLPHRIRSPHLSAGAENRYHYVGRMVGMYYDCSANVLPMMEHILRLNQGVSTASFSICIISGLTNACGLTGAALYDNATEDKDGQGQLCKEKQSVANRRGLSSTVPRKIGTPHGRVVL